MEELEFSPAEQERLDLFSQALASMFATIRENERMAQVRPQFQEVIEQDGSNH